MDSINKLKVIAPITLKGWLERQKEPLEITLFQGYDATEWVVVPPFQIQAQDDWTYLLYNNMFSRFEELQTKAMMPNEIEVEWKYFNSSEDDGYEDEKYDEEDDYEEPELTALIGSTIYN